MSHRGQNRACAIAIVIMLVGIIAGCSREQPGQFTGETTEEYELRIVSISPALTRMVVDCWRHRCGRSPD